jgi:hypothetical protein
MVIAALISFGILLVAWISAPVRDVREAQARVSLGRTTGDALEGGVASLAEAA